MVQADKYNRTPLFEKQSHDFSQSGKSDFEAKHFVKMLTSEHKNNSFYVFNPSNVSWLANFVLRFKPSNLGSN